LRQFFHHSAKVFKRIHATIVTILDITTVTGIMAIGMAVSGTSLTGTRAQLL
jgi:hypothetical protein